jgi:tRNA modification GTPase
MVNHADTIFALASASGRSGVAVIRLSGPASGPALLGLAPDLKMLPLPRRAVRVHLYDFDSNDSRFESESNNSHNNTPFDDQIDEKHNESESSHVPAGLIDDGLAIWFPGPASFTGEDVVELHVHGGSAVLEAVTGCLIRIDGLRPAEPGEYSRRAFENGKLDLTAAEAIADLVDAETTAQRRQALAQMGGALADLYDGWRSQLVGALAYLEACIDFAEEDIPDDLMARSADTLLALRDSIDGHLQDNGIGERIRDGFRIAVTGAPNVGKSSLMNALAKRDVAIVSDIAGTTRDVLEVPMDLGGYAATLIDTAGLRETEDVIEIEGVRRARAAAEAADVRIHLLDASDTEATFEPPVGALVVANKMDQVSGRPPVSNALPLSVKTGTGLDELVTALTDRVRALASDRVNDSPPLTRARHRIALEDCVVAIDRARAGATQGHDMEMIAEDMRVAAQALGRITGRIDVEDLLDKIFKDFCIGK